MKKIHPILKKKSITNQIAAIIILLIAGTVFLCLFINSAFLPEYYSRNKQDQLLDGFEKIQQACTDEKLYGSEFDIPFDSLCANGNMMIEIITADGSVVRSSSGNAEALKRQFFEIIFGADSENTEIITSTSYYMLERTVDSRLLEEYLVLWGTLEDGNQVLMRTPLESINESVSIANKFLLYVGIMAMIASVIVTYVVTRKITNPILDLTDLSERMTNLDFNAKYVQRKKWNNEVDILGEHMNELSENLEMTISELKTANLELKKDIEQKEEIDEMRKEFLSNVSHELKTPIALIQGYAEGLKEGIEEDADSRDFYCDVIVDEAVKMNEMVKKLLTLNQIEFGNDVVAMERFDVTELIRGVIHASGILLQQKEIELYFAETEPVYVWADEFKLEEVITNYLSNAINHCAYEKKIEIKYEDRGNVLRISVFNTGDQIPEADIDQIWVKFYKVDKARTREYGGNGIGLSIVKAIMDSFHRQCGVINHENGVEFWLELDKKNDEFALDDENKKNPDKTMRNHIADENKEC